MRVSKGTGAKSGMPDETAAKPEKCLQKTLGFSPV